MNVFYPPPLSDLVHFLKKNCGSEQGGFKVGARFTMYVKCQNDL